jgi:CheY-like chemotaxis protein
VRIVDTGEGIRADDIPKLFQKFQQLNDANNTRRTGGTGLGLAISKEIVEQHGGKIWAESVFGKGSAFVFTLPQKRIFTILVIDDETNILAVCERILKNSGHTVFCAENGMQGIDMARKVLPHAVVVDMKLPDVSGYEVIGRLKSMDETTHIPILAMSGFQDEIEKVKSLENNRGFPWILKPFNVDEFCAKIETIAGNTTL